MKRVLSFGVQMLVLAGASVAWGQVDVEPQGPSCVSEEDASAFYQARVTTNYNFDFRLKVYLNGVLKHDSTTSVTQSGPYYTFTKTVSLSGWDQLYGDNMNFVGRATLTSGPYSGSYHEAGLWIDPVEPPGWCLLNPGWRAPLDFPQERNGTPLYAHRREENEVVYA